MVFADTLVRLMRLCCYRSRIRLPELDPGQPFMIGSLVALLGFVNQFTSVFQDVAWQYTRVMELDVNVRTARFIQKAYNEKHTPEESVPLPSDWKRISIQGLNFSHKEKLFVIGQVIESSRHFNCVRKRKNE